MWCTRWVLPFLLLPAPTSPPYFVLIFLLSLVMHARPCIYCIFFLIMLFITSNYWSPVPASEINSSIISALGHDSSTTALLDYLPAMIPLIDRAWVDLSRGLFEPFNVTQWEEASVRKAIADYQAEQRALHPEGEVPQVEVNNHNSSLMDIEMTEHTPALEAIRRSWYSMMDIVRTPKFILSLALTHFTSPVASSSIKGTSEDDPHQDANTTGEVKETSGTRSGPFGLKSHYDLRPYGLHMIIDLGIPGTTRTES